MDNREILERAHQILVAQSNVAAEVITGQRELTVAQIGNLLCGVQNTNLRIPPDEVERLFREVGQTAVDSTSDARSLIGAILAAYNRLP